MARTDNDPIDILNTAMDSAIEDTRGVLKELRDRTPRPLVGDKLSPDDEAAYYRRLLATPAIVQAMSAEHAFRYDLPPGGVSKALAEDLERAHKKLRAKEEDE